MIKSTKDGSIKSGYCIINTDYYMLATLVCFHFFVAYSDIFAKHSIVISLINVGSTIGFVDSGINSCIS
ncbi:MAG TPA: hypothetical protein VF700_12675, partial [Segetibacter sp.]